MEDMTSKQMGIALLMLSLAGCSSTTVYHGRVLDRGTLAPVTNVSVEGTWFERGRFSPSLDGLFLRQTCVTATTTDANGRFRIGLSGWNRHVVVNLARYAYAQVSVDAVSPGQEIEIKLSRELPQHTSGGDSLKAAPQK